MCSCLQIRAFWGNSIQLGWIKQKGADAMFKGFTTEKQTTTSASSDAKVMRPGVEWGTMTEFKQTKKRKKKAKKKRKVKKEKKASNNAEINQELIPVLYQAIAGMDRANQRLCELLERSRESTADNRAWVWSKGEIICLRRKLLPD